MSEVCHQSTIGFSLPEVASIRLLSPVLEILPQHAAILGPDGEILFVNRAWRNFAAVNGALGDADVQEGANYLRVCQQAASLGDHEAALIHQRLCDLLRQGAGSFSHDYACHGPGVERWFAMEAVGLHFGGRSHAIVFHNNQTLRHRTSEQLTNKGPMPQSGELICICAGCKRVRDADGNWSEFEATLPELAGRDLTHGICRSCTELLYPDLLDEVA